MLAAIDVERCEHFGTHRSQLEGATRPRTCATERQREISNSPVPEAPHTDIQMASQPHNIGSVAHVSERVAVRNAGSFAGTDGCRVGATGVLGEADRRSIPTDPSSRVALEHVVE